MKSFPREMDLAFTAGMEERLDEIEEERRLAGGPEGLRQVQGRPREGRGQHARREAAGDRDRPHVREVRQAHDLKWGRMGEFLACSGYPECRNTMNFRRDEGKIVPEKEEDVPTDEKCPECSAAMVMKRGRFGRFLACTRYPECKGASRSPSASPARRAAASTSPRSARAVARTSTAARPTRAATSCPGIGRATRPARSAGAPSRQVLEEDRTVRRLSEQGVRLRRDAEAEPPGVASGG